MNSRQKGAAGERELARILRDYGYDTRRGQQYSGANGDARPGEMPAVFHRKNCEPWKTTMLMDDWLKLYGNQREKWVLCSERLPEKSGEYNVVIEGASLPTTLHFFGI